MLFHDRDEAGELLADVLLNLRAERPVVLGIPAGGVVVARHVADRLGAPLGAVTTLGDEPFAATEPGRAASGRTVVVVDDGIRSGATMLAALDAVATAGPRRLLAAAPVAPQRLSLGRHAADLYAVARPAPFAHVRRWYTDFPDVDDDEVRAALADSAQFWAYAGATSL
ncbi:MAG TPA: phosphoribosyltransferase family protein [Gryllotalpicola sp.]